MDKIVNDLNQGTWEIKEHFNHHPQERGQTYVEHLGHSWNSGFEHIEEGMKHVFHGCFPFFFTTEAHAPASSNTIPQSDLDLSVEEAEEIQI